MKLTDSHKKLTNQLIETLIRRIPPKEPSQYLYDLIKDLLL